ncbi:hypothetical protein KZ829_03770 [Actinoplanes hulinensis]|uniref:Secreted protein n=1 Tax=Actinoplanes hulinensis TaxID=1144547 RepID=A0ABS7AWA2_9ACTN|nr:DUF6023 family protein [Actinoplanes hulinensis]MBW6432859.1 hypothetical protein [Actinoplanes hulinensis]
MSSERGRGVVLHALAALILVIGLVWWWRAAPDGAGDGRLAHWRLTAEQLLPDIGEQEVANTLVLEPGTGYDEIVEVERGDFLVSVVCAGDDGARVRVSLGGTDSGRGLRCSGARTPDIFSVGLTRQLRMHVSVDASGPVVFRYALQRSSG